MDQDSKGAANQLGISTARLGVYAKKGRVVGARKLGGRWVYPDPVELLPSPDETQPSRSTVNAPTAATVGRPTPDGESANPVEVPIMAKGEDCPTCALNQHKVELAEDKAAAVTGQLATATAELATARAAASKPAETKMPTVEQFVQHCEGGSCADHKTAFEQVKTGIVEEAWKNIPDAKLQELVNAKGIMPDRIPLGDVKIAG